MGYTTKFSRSLSITPKLSQAQIDYLQRFSTIRHVSHDVTYLNIDARIHDPLREAVGLPFGEEGAYFVGSFDHPGLLEEIEQGYEIEPYFLNPESSPSVLSQNRSPPSIPGFSCGWTVSDDGKKLMWDGSEKFRFFPEWLTYLQQHFFAPWGRTLDGHIRWSGEEAKDKGFLVVGPNQTISAIDKYSPEGEAFMAEQKRLKTIRQDKKHLEDILPSSQVPPSRKLKI